MTDIKSWVIVIAAVIGAFSSTVLVFLNSWYKKKEIRFTKALDSKTAEIKSFLKSYLALENTLIKSYKEAYYLDLFGFESKKMYEEIDTCLEDFEYNCRVVKLLLKEPQRQTIDQINALIKEARKGIRTYYSYTREAKNSEIPGVDPSLNLDKVQDLLSKTLPPLYNKLELSWHEDLAI